MNIDIILPIHKANNFVFEAIDSVINQTYEFWILHIIDDASGDNSLNNIKKKYGDLKGKIKYYQLDDNKRQAYARNFVVSKSNGRYIAFIDQDDLWLPEKLKKQINYFHQHDVEAVHSNLKLINNANIIIYCDKWMSENQTRREVNWNQPKIELTNKIFQIPNIRIISSMISRNIFEKIGGFKDQFFGGEDETFWVEIALNSKIGFIDEILFYRREHETNAVNRFKVERLKGYLKSIDFVKNSYQDFINKQQISKKSFDIYIRLLNVLYQKGEFKELIYYLIIVLLKYPINFIKHFYYSKLNK